MITIKTTVLTEGMFEDGRSVKLVQFNNGSYGIYLYIHCEDRHSEYGTYLTLHEAEEDFNRIVRQHELQKSITDVVNRRKERGATYQDIENYKQNLMFAWRNNQEILDFITYGLRS